jgi:hypothetical protein
MDDHVGNVTRITPHHASPFDPGQKKSAKTVGKGLLVQSARKQIAKNTVGSIHTKRPTRTALGKPRCTRTPRTNPTVQTAITFQVTAATVPSVGPRACRSSVGNRARSAHSKGTSAAVNCWASQETNEGPPSTCVLNIMCLHVPVRIKRHNKPCGRSKTKFTTRLSPGFLSGHLGQGCSSDGSAQPPLNADKSPIGTYSRDNSTE